MNLGINGLSKLVSQELKRPLLNGDVFIFFGKNRQTVKLLCWDGDGFLLYQKRLERGTFELPRFKPDQKAAEMPYRTLSAIMRGVSLRSVRYRKRLRIGSSEILQPPDYQ
jgi:transposase